jgi:hypothetical protein
MGAIRIASTVTTPPASMDAPRSAPSRAGPVVQTVRASDRAPSVPTMSRPASSPTTDLLNDLRQAQTSAPPSRAPLSRPVFNLPTKTASLSPSPSNANRSGSANLLGDLQRWSLEQPARPPVAIARPVFKLPAPAVASSSNAGGMTTIAQPAVLANMGLSSGAAAPAGPSRTEQARVAMGPVDSAIADWYANNQAPAASAPASLSRAEQARVAMAPIDRAIADLYADREASAATQSSSTESARPSARNPADRQRTPGREVPVDASLLGSADAVAHRGSGRVLPQFTASYYTPATFDLSSLNSFGGAADATAYRGSGRIDAGPALTASYYQPTTFELVPGFGTAAVSTPPADRAGSPRMTDTVESMLASAMNATNALPVPDAPIPVAPSEQNGT